MKISEYKKEIDLYEKKQNEKDNTNLLLLPQDNIQSKQRLDNIDKSQKLFAKLISDNINATS
jgi:hypothetical protein